MSDERQSGGDPLRRRAWYTGDELDAVQLVARDDGSYQVVIAGDVLGTIRPHRTSSGRRSGWDACHCSGAPVHHIGAGVRPATLEGALLDLVADVHAVWQNRQASA
ncbi:hypothetical protein [Nonomuraea basaltis]|uniref:hypothetical protein n=1 Tax=Nonomuraea basaltis TaxID=2495887 RepID=UPI00110C6990|nr:hypothetical protein [Nonomuraea basaltis]TMR87892.1 hypothetical protein EJK15_69290 [Nonomuraea basaltis]